MENCIGMPELGYGEFSDWLHRRVGDQRIPISGSFEVTMRCNLRCQHCYIPLEQRAKHLEPELSLPEVQRILDEITDAGCLWLLLTGGDPFLRPDFLDVYTYAKHKGLILTLFTNGTLLTPRIADILAEWRPFNIEITLYGASQETYERVTGIPGSYARCRRGIDLLLERNLPLGLKSVLMTLNQHELTHMKTLAASLGVPFRFDPIVHAANDGSLRPTDLRLTPAEIVAIEKADSRRARLWPDQFHAKPQISASDRSMYICGAGRQGFHIDAAGRMSICMSMRQPAYDLRRGTFHEGWQLFLPQVTAQQYQPDFACLGCEMRQLCIQCPAMAALESGNPETRVDFLCQVTRQRWEAFA